MSRIERAQLPCPVDCCAAMRTAGTPFCSYHMKFVRPADMRDLNHFLSKGDIVTYRRCIDALKSQMQRDRQYPHPPNRGYRAYNRRNF